MSRPIRLLALLFAAAMVIAACSSDDDLSAFTDDGGDSDADAGGDGDNGGGGGDGDSASAFLGECDFILDAITSGPTNLDPEADVDETVNFFNELAGDAPDEISDDLSTFAEFFAIVAGAFDPEDPGAINQEALEALNDPAFQEAAEEATNNITAYFDENCGAAG